MQPNWLWGYFIPLGLLLLAWGGLPPHKARRVTTLAALTLALAVIGYWATGFALHLGGAQVVNPDDPALAGLDLLFARDVTGGIFGMTGFALAGDEVTPTALGLFLSYLPLLTGAALMLTLALAELRRWVLLLAGALASAFIFPVAACWIWGGGWLSHIGETLALGHGFVDFGGSALLLWLPATLALGMLLWQPRRAREADPGPPPAHFPLLANLGALFLGLGWAGWTLASPFHTYGATLDLNRAALSAFLGIAGAVLTSQLYAWLVTGEPEPLLVARGQAAGWGAILAGAAFMPPWAALMVGLIAGLLFPLALYLVEEVLRLQDRTATIALGLSGGLWGLLSVGLMADGRWGQGWNGVAPLNGAELLPGVQGWFFGGGGQLLAQLAGLVVLGLWGLLWGTLLGLLARPRNARVTIAPAPENIATPSAAESRASEPQPEAALPETPPPAEPEPLADALPPEA